MGDPGRAAAGPPLGVAEVVGPSMVPTLRHGDRLLVRYGAPVRAGDVVVLRHPLQQDLLIVKRAAGRRDGGWWVLGDNPYAEPDSRQFGAVPEELVLGRAVLRWRLLGGPGTGPAGLGPAGPGRGRPGTGGRGLFAAVLRAVDRAVRALPVRIAVLRPRPAPGTGTGAGTGKSGRAG
ncbi:hypothetical protein GCM10010406_04680 [Streptomyces thermolineatus]|uniref:Peptidase S24/S26A/S26B/S26C domain-containing protein n=1 Tax=Streptomyces thermolineatus TaxID=44033 RepID=A0ABN3KX82_9ACTN